MNKLRREMVDQLQWGERQRSGTVALGSSQPVDDLLLIDALETREREGWAGTVTQLDLPDGVVGCVPHGIGGPRDRLLQIPPQDDLIQQYHGNDRIVAGDRDPFGSGDLRDQVSDQIVLLAHADALAWA
jgi:hypothetical protein